MVCRVLPCCHGLRVPALGFAVTTVCVSVPCIVHEVHESCTCMLCMHDGAEALLCRYSDLGRVSAGLFLLSRCQGIEAGTSAGDQGLAPSCSF
jgi:hypothetical protein